MGKSLGNTGFVTHDSEFNGHYRGQVMNNVDPLMKGRIQVQILPMFSGIPTVQLPWAIAAGPLFSGAGTGYGTFMVPANDSWVWCFFEQGDVYQPVYFAEAPDGVHGVPAESQSNYPHRRVIHTKAGIVLYTDDFTKTVVIKTPGNIQAKLDDATNTLALTHPTGAYIEIDPIGQILLNGINIIVTTNGVTTWTGTGSINITSTGNINVTGATVNINP